MIDSTPTAVREESYFIFTLLIEFRFKVIEETNMKAFHNSIERIPVNMLQFDPDNPRLPISMRNHADESEIVTWMLTDASLEELLESIAQQGFFDGEPILGYRDNGKVIVVEGNRRLAAVKLFNNPKLATKKIKRIRSIIDEAETSPPQELPVIIYQQRTEILKYLGYRHITGVKSWSALSKARYLNQLRKDFGDIPLQKQFSALAKEIGSNANYVARLLTTLKLYEIIETNDFFDIPNLDERTIDFSLLTTALSYTKISNFVGLKAPKDIQAENLSERRLQELSEWIYKRNEGNKTRLGDSRNLRTLSAVVDHPEALKRFRDGVKLEEASLYTDEPEKIFLSAMNDIDSALTMALNQIPHVSSTNQKDLNRLLEFGKKLGAVYSIAKGKSETDDSNVFDLR